MFERRIQNQLHEWAEKNNRKPLILRGARQVGKTTIVEQFGKEFLRPGGSHPGRGKPLPLPQ